MTALPDLNVSGAVVGQKFTVDFRNNIVSATLGQQYGDASDMLLIYNLSPCNFSVMLTATNRTFNLPSGVTSNPIPLSYRGTSDTGLILTVKSIIVAGTPNTVSFDWFRPGEPILAAPASSNPGVGSVVLTSITASSVTFPTPDNWVISQDGGGNLNFTNTTTGQVYTMEPSAALGLFAIGFTEILDDTANNASVLQSKLSGGVSTGVAIRAWSGSVSQYIMSFGGQFEGAPSWADGAGNLTVGNNLSVVNGVIAEIDGQTTAGNYGVPMIVAQALNQPVTTTGDHLLLSYAPPASGIYRLNGYVEMNGSVSANIICRATYADDLGTPTAFFVSPSGAGAAGLAMGGSNSFGPSYSGNLQPITVFAKTGTNINCHYNNPSGVPNDHVWFIIERLA